MTGHGHILIMILQLLKQKGLSKKITIDPSGLMADVKQENNVLNNKFFKLKVK
jgi:hypothetical protein